MALSYYYEFTAAAPTPAEQLENFLHEVEKVAQSLGFAPTLVLNVPFDTPERRDFARRLSGSYSVEDKRLKGTVALAEGQLWNHDPDSGRGRLIPRKGVVLVLTDEQGCETCFGFFKYPERILDVQGAILAQTDFRDAWGFRDFVDTPDPRYRKIVGMFADAGYLADVDDEYK